MTPIIEPIAGRIHTIILAPVTAYVVLQRRIASSRRSFLAERLKICSSVEM